MFQLKQFPTQNIHLFGPLLIITLAVIGFVFNNSFNELFIYQRTGINDQQFWRLITGHLFHTNYAHFLLNTLAIILLWALHGQYYSRINYLSLCLFSALFISICIYFLDPTMEKYVGLSGVLHALFAWGAIKDIENKDKTGFILLLGIIIKVSHEQIYGASEDVASLINADVAVNAHLSGMIAGFIFYFLIKLLSQYFSKKS